MPLTNAAFLSELKMCVVSVAKDEAASGSYREDSIAVYISPCQCLKRSSIRCSFRTGRGEHEKHRLTQEKSYPDPNLNFAFPNCNAWLETPDAERKSIVQKRRKVSKKLLIVEAFRNCHKDCSRLLRSSSVGNFQQSRHFHFHKEFDPCNIYLRSFRGLQESKTCSFIAKLQQFEQKRCNESVHLVKRRSSLPGQLKKCSKRHQARLLRSLVKSKRARFRWLDKAQLTTLLARNSRAQILAVCVNTKNRTLPSFRCLWYLPTSREPKLVPPVRLKISLGIHFRVP